MIDFSSASAEKPPINAGSIEPVTQALLGSDILAAYIPILASLGVIILLVAWLPLLLDRFPMSLPIICTAIGMAVFTVTPFAAYSPHPIATPYLIEKTTELIVIVSLMGAGLKISRPWSIQAWSLPIRLLGVAMPITILALALAGHVLLGFGLASAVLIGACLAPTDPVLAADIQIKDPGSDQASDARFALTSEAGLNDALAFPFVHFAIALSLVGISASMVADWALHNVAIRMVVGTAVGVSAGWLLGKIIYQLPTSSRLSRTGDGFVALGATLIVYAVAELLHGYGFLSVFLAGLMLRRASDGHDFNHRLHDFADELERLMMMVMLIFFGGMLANGGLLVGLSWQVFGFAFITIVIVRPVAGWIGLFGARVPDDEKATIAFFGIRGLGSVYYLAYALNHGNFGAPLLLWQTLAVVVAASLVIHGMAASPTMRWLDSRRSTGTRP